MITDGPGLLLCTKDPPYQIWEVYYRGEVSDGKKNERYSKRNFF